MRESSDVSKTRARTPTFVFLTLELEEISPHEALQDVGVVRLRRLDVKMMTHIVTSRLQQENRIMKQLVLFQNLLLFTQV